MKQSEIKNLYIAYVFQPDLYEWKNKKEMIYKYAIFGDFITIEFMNESSEYHIERRYRSNGSMQYQMPYKNGKRDGFYEFYYYNGNTNKILYKNGIRVEI